jgi:ribosomal protein S27AE
VAEQFNVRLPDDAARAVRVRAAELGVKPRDVILAGLVALGIWQAQTEAPPRADDASAEAADQRGDEAATPRRDRRKDAADKAGEAGTSGEGTAGPTQVDRQPAAVEQSTTRPSSQSGCPECGGELVATDDGLMVVCGECGFRAGKLPGV